MRKFYREGLPNAIGIGDRAGMMPPKCPRCECRYWRADFENDFAKCMACGHEMTQANERLREHDGVWDIRFKDPTENMVVNLMLHRRDLTTYSGFAAENAKTNDRFQVRLDHGVFHVSAMSAIHAGEEVEVRGDWAYPKPRTGTRPRPLAPGEKTPDAAMAPEVKRINSIDITVPPPVDPYVAERILRATNVLFEKDTCIRAAHKCQGAAGFKPYFVVNVRGLSETAVFDDPLVDAFDCIFELERAVRAKLDEKIKTTESDIERSAKQEAEGFEAGCFFTRRLRALNGVIDL